MNDIEKYNEAKQEVFEYFHDKHNLLLLSGNAIPKVGDVGCTTDGTRVKVTKVITKPKP